MLGKPMGTIKTAVFLVLVTLSLSGIVYLVVSGFGEYVPKGPYIALQHIGDGDYRVVDADGGMLWSDFAVEGCETVPDGGVLPGDRLTGCVPGASITHIETGAIVWSVSPQ